MLLPGESPWTEEPGGLQSAVAESDTAEQLSLFFPWWCLGRIHTVTAARLVTTVAHALSIVALFLVSFTWCSVPLQ